MEALTDSKPIDIEELKQAFRLIKKNVSKQIWDNLKVSFMAGATTWKAFLMTGKIPEPQAEVLERMSEEAKIIAKVIMAVENETSINNKERET